MWIGHRHMCVTSLLNSPPSPPYPSKWSQSAHSRCPESNSHWLSVLHLVMYVSMLLWRNYWWWIFRFFNFQREQWNKIYWSLSSIKVKKKKTKYLYSSKKEMTQWDLFLNKAILSSILQFNHYRNALMERGIILETNMITHMATL